MKIKKMMMSGISEMFKKEVSLRKLFLNDSNLLFLLLSLYICNYYYHFGKKSIKKINGSFGELF